MREAVPCIRRRIGPNSISSRTRFCADNRTLSRVQAADQKILLRYRDRLRNKLFGRRVDQQLPRERGVRQTGASRAKRKRNSDTGGCTYNGYEHEKQHKEDEVRTGAGDWAILRETDRR